MKVDPSASFKPLPDWIAFDLCLAYPVPGGNLLLHNTRNGKRAMVKPEVYKALMHCREFKTIEQHTATLVGLESAMQGQQADIRMVLQSMLGSGMMVSAKSACDQFKASAVKNTPERQDSAPVVAILTWERPQALERLLESIVRNCATDKVHRIHVIDDSRKTENIELNQALTERFAARISCPLRYFGQQEQRSWIDEMVKQLPAHENAIRFLADGARWRDFWTSGLSRNLALLLSPGHKLVMIDDDVVCDVFDPPQMRHDITFSDDHREVVFYAGEQDWSHLHQPINPDPVGRHMQCLGLTFSEALEVLGQSNLKASGFQNATALQISELHAGSEILLTECGSLGCPGTNDNTWLPDLTPASLKRMLSSEEATARALSSRKAWSGRNHPHFAPRPNMSQITGFDNRRMLPPYLPIQRGEDRLFGYMLDYIYPTSVTLDYPWAVPHLPLPDRKWRDRDLDFSPGDTFPMFFVEKIIEHKSACLSTRLEERLSSLSGWFGDLASAPAHTLTAMYQDSRLGGDSARLGQLTGLLASTDPAPVNWQNYLRNGITQLNADLDFASRENFKVRGVPATLEGDDLIEFWRSVWRDFSDAISAWPEIRQAAARIASPGQAA